MRHVLFVGLFLFHNPFDGWRFSGNDKPEPTPEVGKHTYHVKADGSVHEITVPPRSAEGVREVRVEVRLAKYWVDYTMSREQRDHG